MLYSKVQKHIRSMIQRQCTNKYFSISTLTDTTKSETSNPKA